MVIIIYSHSKEPDVLARQDGKRPDVLTLIPWRRGKSLTWDVTVAHTLADSYVSVTARSGGAAAEQAAGRNTAKYDLLVQIGRMFGWLEFAGLENDGVEQEQTYILHTMKNFNVYDM